MCNGDSRPGEKGNAHGTVTAVWFDSEEENFVVQHEFVRLSFYKEEFAVFPECLNEAQKKYREQDHGRRE
jgi:hypothetical protein